MAVMLKLKPALLFALAINLLPLVGVVVFDWDIANLVFLYWVENVIVGVYIFLRELFTPYTTQIAGKLFMLCFFSVHYGGFCAGHGVLIINLFDMGEFSMDATDDWPFVFIFMGMLVAVIEHFAAQTSPSLYPFLGGIALFYLWRLGADTLAVLSNKAPGQASWVIAPDVKTAQGKSSNNSQWMVEPYKRIVILHVALLVGGIGIQSLGSPMALLLILVLLKTAVELFLYNSEDKKTGNQSAD